MEAKYRVTPAEFQIMRVLWSHDEPLPVAEVRSSLQRGSVPAYTTVMTLLDKLARKGSVARTKRGKAYFYIPRVSRDEVLLEVVSDFARAYFGGRTERLAAFASNGERTAIPTSDADRPPGRKGRTPVELTKPARDTETGPEEMDVVLL